MTPLAAENDVARRSAADPKTQAIRELFQLAVFHVMLWSAILALGYFLDMALSCFAPALSFKWRFGILGIGG